MCVRVCVRMCACVRVCTCTRESACVRVCVVVAHNHEPGRERQLTWFYVCLTHGKSRAHCALCPVVTQPRPRTMAFHTQRLHGCSCLLADGQIVVCLWLYLTVNNTYLGQPACVLLTNIVHVVSIVHYDNSYNSTIFYWCYKILSYDVSRHMVYRREPRACCYMNGTRSSPLYAQPFHAAQAGNTTTTDNDNTWLALVQLSVQS